MLEPVSKRTRGPTASCGRSVHGKLSNCGAMRLCFACGRAGGPDSVAAGRWKHVGSGPFWASFPEWCASIGEGWAHSRDLIRDPLAAGDCVCCRKDCVLNLYHKHRLRASKDETGSWDKMVRGQSSSSGRYPTARSQVCRAGDAPSCSILYVNVFFGVFAVGRCSQSLKYRTN